MTPSTLTGPYPYPTSNSDLIKYHKLLPCPEGGYLLQTVNLTSSIPSKSTWAPNSPGWPADHPRSGPALGEREQLGWGPGAAVLGGPAEEPMNDLGGRDTRSDATIIYYLITPDSYQGKMHMNLYPHFHIHQAGRALYTLIKPPSPAEPNATPEVYRIIMGPNIRNGEVTQLYVPGGWWKASEIPEEDMLLLDSPEADAQGLREYIGCLISEVVVPGWEVDQHAYLDEQKLREMWRGQPGWEVYTKYIEVAPKPDESANGADA